NPVMSTSCAVGDNAKPQAAQPAAEGRDAKGRFVRPDRVEVDEWRLLQEECVPPEALSGVLRLLPADWVGKMLRIACPCAVQAVSDHPLQDLAEIDRRDAARPSPIGANGAAGPSAPTPNGPIGGAAAAPRAPIPNGANGSPRPAGEAERPVN